MLLCAKSAEWLLNFNGMSYFKQIIKRLERNRMFFLFANHMFYCAVLFKSSYLQLISQDLLNQAKIVDYFIESATYRFLFTSSKTLENERVSKANE